MQVSQIATQKNHERGINNSGQVSLEYLTIVAFMLFAVAILSIYSFSYLGQAIAIQKTQNATERISIAANSVAALGSGNTSLIQVELPSGVQTAGIIGKQITIKIQTGAGINSVASYTEAYLTPSSFSVEPGFHTLSIEMVDSNVVVTEVQQ